MKLAALAAEAFRHMVIVVICFGLGFAGMWLVLSVFRLLGCA